MNQADDDLFPKQISPYHLHMDHANVAFASGTDSNEIFPAPPDDQFSDDWTKISPSYGLTLDFVDEPLFPDAVLPSSPSTVEPFAQFPEACQDDEPSSVSSSSATHRDVSSQDYKKRERPPSDETVEAVLDLFSGLPPPKRPKRSSAQPLVHLTSINDFYQSDDPPADQTAPMPPSPRVAATGSMQRKSVVCKPAAVAPKVRKVPPPRSPPSAPKTSQTQNGSQSDSDHPRTKKKRSQRSPNLKVYYAKAECEIRRLPYIWLDPAVHEGCWTPQLFRERLPEMQIRMFHVKHDNTDPELLHLLDERHPCNKEGPRYPHNIFLSKLDADAAEQAVSGITVCRGPCDDHTQNGHDSRVYVFMYNGKPIATSAALRIVSSRKSTDMDNFRPSKPSFLKPTVFNG